MPDAALDRFFEISVVLTGEKRLPRFLSDDYYKSYGSRLTNLFNQAGAMAQGSELRELIQEGMRKDYGIFLEANAVIRLWFTGYFEKRSNDRSGPLKPAHYQASLMWHLIGAPVPAHSLLEYSYWKDAPVLAVLEDE